ncbi:hypothetical protein DVH24_001769 [Malus domestica]|uniref:Uncharacterized protein n=1 Tax=Malus domestica TaxID=3750 RepID=A0A498I9N1_MALDO|nr:hypothetical protein DVH24_001769 [Malus domestica]
MEALEGARRVGGYGRNCLNQCCIPVCVGAQLPLYFFKKLNMNDGDTGLLGHEKREPPIKELN